MNAIKMSVYSTFKTADESGSNSAAIFVIQTMNIPKFIRSVEISKITSDQYLKHVLVEYNYTEWKRIHTGVPDKTDRVPNTDVVLHEVLKGCECKDKIIKMLFGDKCAFHVTMYSRRKMVNFETKEYDPHKWQFVLDIMPMWMYKDWKRGYGYEISDEETE